MHAYHRPVKYGTELLAGFVLLPSPGTSPYADFFARLWLSGLPIVRALYPSLEQYIYLNCPPGTVRACLERGPPLCRLLGIVQCVLYLAATSNLGGIRLTLESGNTWLQVLMVVVLFMLEKSVSARNGGQTNLGRVILKSCRSPIIFMSISGIGINFASRHRVPAVLEDTANLLANCYQGLALFSIGMTMVGKISLLAGRKLFKALLMVLSKCIVMPIM